MKGAIQCSGRERRVHHGVKRAVFIKSQRGQMENLEFTRQRQADGNIHINQMVIRLTITLNPYVLPVHF